MLRSDPFEVAAAPGRVGALARLPRYVEPVDGEALFSWMARLSSSLGLTTPKLARDAFGLDLSKDPEWWRRPSPFTLASIERRTGVELRRLEAMTLTGWAGALDDEGADRFSAERWRRTARGHPLHRRRIDVCPQCVAGNGRPSLQLIWMLGWAGACPRHGVVLTDVCPSCRGVLRFQEIRAGRPVDLFACLRCGAHLGSESGDEAHGPALGLQAALVAGKRTGTTCLPGLAPIEWRTSLALADTLLSMIWADFRNELRQRLFARISADLGLSTPTCAVLPWTTNYGGLLMLTWLLEDLPVRLPRAIAILCAPKLDRLLKRVPGLDAELEERLGSILACATPKRPQGRKAWRPWLDGLSQSAAELHDRATRERSKHRRQRLTALAELKGGGSVVTAAAKVGVAPNTIYEWLHRAAAEGLEAALERPTGNAALTSAQAETLAEWIAASDMHQTRRAIVGRAAELFDIDLKLDAASRLLTKHRRAKPGHRRRLWGPKHGPRQVFPPTHDPSPGP